MCQGPLPETLGRMVGEGVNAGEWCRVGAGNPLPWLLRVPWGVFVKSVGLSRALSSPKWPLSLVLLISSRDNDTTSPDSGSASRNEYSYSQWIHMPFPLGVIL